MQALDLALDRRETYFEKRAIEVFSKFKLQVEIFRDERAKKDIQAFSHVLHIPYCRLPTRIPPSNN